MKNGGDFSRRFCFKPVRLVNSEVARRLRMRVAASPKLMPVNYQTADFITGRCCILQAFSLEHHDTFADPG